MCVLLPDIAATETFFFTINQTHEICTLTHLDYTPNYCVELEN